MKVLIVLPIVLPLVLACISMCLWRGLIVQRWIGVAGMVALAVASVALFIGVYRNGIVALQIADFAAPFGITLVADLFSSIMIMASTLMGVAVAVYSMANIDNRRESFGYYPLLHLLMLGVCGAFLTGDMFNLYVFFEIMLLSSFVLLTLGGERGQMEGAIKYVTLNLISSAVFLAGVGILYGVTGTLNMADLAVLTNEMEDSRVLSILAMMFFIAFGVKAAIFPLFFWLPASYHTPPPAVSAIFAALLTKVGLYSLIRVFTLIFDQDLGFTHTIILVISGVSMITGVLGAAAQTEFRRILAFHSVSQVGYMLMGLGLMCTIASADDLEAIRPAVLLGLAGAVIFIVHHLLVKPGLFLASGIVERMSGTGRLDDLGGYFRRHPGMSLLFFLPAMSLAGIPPLSGFWAKYILVRAGLEMQQYLIVVAALATGLLTLYSMVKIWAAVYWSDPPEGGLFHDEVHQRAARRGLMKMVIPLTVLTAIIVLFGLAAGPIFEVAHQTAEQLLDSSHYIDAVAPVRVTAALEEVPS